MASPQVPTGLWESTAVNITIEGHRLEGCTRLVNKKQAESQPQTSPAEPAAPRPPSTPKTICWIHVTVTDALLLATDVKTYEV
jgi:hypothetical protein